METSRLAEWPRFRCELFPAHPLYLIVGRILVCAAYRAPFRASIQTDTASSASSERQFEHTPML